MPFQKGHTINISRTCSAKTRKKIGLAHKGKKPSPEICQKISVANKGKKAWNKGKLVDRTKYPTMGHFKKHSNISKEKMSKAHKGHWVKSKNPRWKGGKYLTKDGYKTVLIPNHPFCNQQGYILEHRLVMEKYLNRYLDPKETVHHINEMKDDNRIENLMLFISCGFHAAFHRWGYCNPSTIIFDGRNL